MATCRFCAEETPQGAARCHHCGEATGGPFQLGCPRWSGDALVVRPGAEVKAKGCLVCGSSAAVSTPRRLAYTPAWVYLGLLVGVLPVVPLALVARRRTTLRMPLCGRCLRRWRQGDVAVALLAGLGVVALPGLGALTDHVVQSEGARSAVLVVGLLAWLGALVALHLHVSRRLRPRCTLLADHEVHLVFPDDYAARRLVDVSMHSNGP